MSGDTVAFPLRACAAAYGWAIRCRNYLYDHGWFATYSSAIPVVSVGNLTVGGNGKTPLVIAIADQLIARGYRPVVLSRGYGGSEKGPHVVGPEDTAERVGDEPILIARKTGVPVVIARKRADGAQLIERTKLGTIIILDDGFQHRALERCCNIVCIRVDDGDAIQEFLRGELLPHGRFREPLRLGMLRADTVMLVNRNAGVHSSPVAEEDLARVFPASTTVFRSNVTVEAIQALDGEEVLKPQPVVALSGIANPKAFHRTLEALGYTLLERKVFGDHHQFSKNDIDQLLEQFPDTKIICTEKDGVKLRGLTAPGTLFELRMKAQIRPADAFMVHLERSIGRARTDVENDK